ncbi:L-alanine-DL-glutamate epimerase-like enolase superfamily enzyme [Pontibacter ummariensis]|uniref:Dipeptide epimerase n=1 Tax=Pontibacter ummariensis TaxID=1610492 RepID=A0A239BE78_9BACT|nr:dipeptide epimerase [Pontibacter ummariensis]PRY16477.1 L-alanine-DL-glutamate epimerase-like enolase superfamily enzyme [Pontibacter ummariensis]SNS05861.1 L-alanine-DL-glutamate epimerase [Pontibacter ummariensis]
MLKLTIRSFNLPLRHTFTISYDSRDVQETLIVELQHGEHKGYGEATSNPYYGFTIENMTNALESIREQIEGAELNSPEAFWGQMQPLLADNPFALCALDMAANDLYGKMKGQPLYRMWGLETDRMPLTDYTIGIDTVENMVKKLKECPWPIYKIKLGTPDDVRIVQELRRHTDAVFRVDANCAWGVEQTIENARQLKPLGVEFIEQPMRATDMDGMKQVYERAVLPLIADESCITEGDVAKCHGHFHGVNIKLVKCGGLTPARRMIAEAKKLGMKVMVGCMTESTVGISAIAQLLPLLDYVDMDGALLLSKDIATGVTIDYGRVSYSTLNGTGTELIA